MRQIKIILLLIVTIFPLSIKAQQQKQWRLSDCIDYAKKNSIQIRTKQISKETALLELNSAKAQIYPTLSFSTNHNVAFQNKATTYNDYNEASDKTTYSGNYGLNSNVTLYQGGKIRNTIRQQTLLDMASGYDLEQTLMDIEISVTQAYLQIIYNNESLKTAKDNLQLSIAQVNRGEELLRAGSLSKVDIAQLQSQAAKDKYQIVTVENTLKTSILKLKQLLELGLNEDFDITYPNISDESVLTQIPSLNDIYNTAQQINPGVLSSKANTEASETAIKIAKASQLPSISGSAGVSTGSSSNMSTSFGSQFTDRMSENVGISLSIPIFNGKSAKTSIERAKLQNNTAKLQEETTNKNLVSTIESLYNDAVAAQNQYIAANETLRSANISYNYIDEQFKTGLKNIVELITEKNNYSNAQSSQLQAKFSAVLALKILEIYQNKPIEL